MFSSDKGESYSVIEYPHLTTLNLMFSKTKYDEQLLHKFKTHLSHLPELIIKHDQLRTVTENFTRDAT